MRCSEKIRYINRKEAKRARNIRAMAMGMHLYVYKCPECTFFHLTKYRIGNY
jgi:transposase-like protein